MRRYLIDDERNLPSAEGNYTYRTAEAGLVALVDLWVAQRRFAEAWDTDDLALDELYLDHDLGPGSDIRLVVRFLETTVNVGVPLDIGQIFIVSANPIAVEWINDHLRYYKISEKALGN